MSASPISRRTVLRAGTATAALLSTGGLLAQPASADVPTSQYFDIHKPSYDVFRKKMLHESHHVMQSFAFDVANRRLFTAQIQNGSSGNDLCVTQLDPVTGNRVGSMHLNNSGHGVSIGVESVGTASYIWMECDADGTDDSARGTALARFKFVNGQSPLAVKHLKGSKGITCATDPIHKRIVIRRVEDGKVYYSLYPLAQAAAGDYSAPLARFPQPALATTKVTFQGYTIYGQYLYTLDGDGHADPADIDSSITKINMNTGRVVDRALTKAGESLVFREPEGMAIHRTPAGETRLCLGFGSRDTLTGANRYANIFYKKDLVG